MDVKSKVQELKARETARQRFFMQIQALEANDKEARFQIAVDWIVMELKHTIPSIPIRDIGDGVVSTRNQLRNLLGEPFLNKENAKTNVRYYNAKIIEAAIAVRHRNKDIDALLYQAIYDVTENAKDILENARAQPEDLLDYEKARPKKRT